MKIKMENSQLIGFQDSELDRELTFEVSKDVKVTTKITFRKGDIIDQLISRIKELEKRVNILNKSNVIVSEDALTKLWDNENDRRWDNV